MDFPNVIFNTYKFPSNQHWYIKGNLKQVIKKFGPLFPHYKMENM